MSTIAMPISAPGHVSTRSYLQNVIDVLAAVGWVRETEVTGQVDPAAAPTTSGFVGTLYFKSTDALSAELPIYLRISFYNYTHGSYNVCCPINYGVGLGHNGSSLNAETAIYLPGIVTATSYPNIRGTGYMSTMFASGDGGSLRLCDQPEAYAYSTSYPDRGVHAHGFVTIARIKDADGNPTAEGIVLVSGENSVGNSSQPMTMSTIKPSGIMVNRSRGLCPIITEHVGSSTTVSAPGQTASVDGVPQIQHPWACTPRLYPFEEIAFLPSHSVASTGDILKVQVGTAVKSYIFVGRVGFCPSTVGSTYGSSTSTIENRDMLLDAGIAMLWE